jgi:hypothetical protein
MVTENADMLSDINSTEDNLADKALKDLKGIGECSGTNSTRYWPVRA